MFYSAGTDALAQVTDAVANDVSGQGQFHFGLLKKPIGGGSDITKSGFQPSGINEGVIYGGIFEEDSSTGTVTKSLSAAAAANNGTAGATTAAAAGSSKCKRDVVRRSRRGNLGVAKRSA